MPKRGPEAAQISRISVYALDLPLTRPYSLSGRCLKFDRLDSTLVKIETGDGRVGWGEGCPWGHTYLPAHGEGIRAAATILAPALICQLVGYIEREEIPPLLAATYPLSDLRRAQEDFLAKAHTGNLVVTHSENAEKRP